MTVNISKISPFALLPSNVVDKEVYNNAVGEFQRIMKDYKQIRECLESNCDNKVATSYSNDIQRSSKGSCIAPLEKKVFNFESVVRDVTVDKGSNLDAVLTLKELQTTVNVATKIRDRIIRFCDQVIFSFHA
ncbi:hypothetical protein [Candidatus Sneabacter namystus]|uniref:Uncharacterized protein n=1 Tax=Candidatus Sneabacter namystus TaxID=2601646 RepID=A0A5C0UIH6_9RICK|nr:hypothetical protein [Candidatus Sneabacter namystus]QEK39550.1 hypothetical protein FZC37_01180 [Candidatus Sneabacter namystus]